MNRVSRAPILAVLLLVGSPPALAQQIDRETQLLPGGQTIGGPGAVRDLADTFVVFESRLERAVCVTIVNLGALPVSIQIPGVEFAPANVGRTMTACASKVKNIALGCRSESGNCRYLWRVDKAD